MPNNLSQIEKIVLKGYFKRSEKTKQEGIKGLDLSKLSTDQQEILAFMNQNFDFEVNILYFNSDSGIFIARGDDVLGESVIYGTIKGVHKYGTIKGVQKKRMDFKKRYIGDSRHKFPVQRADSLDYIGLMEVFEEGIYCNGRWETHRGSPENGEWKLDSVKEST